MKKKNILLKKKKYFMKKEMKSNVHLKVLVLDLYTTNHLNYQNLYLHLHLKIYNILVILISPF